MNRQDIDGLEQMLDDVHRKSELRGAVDLDFVGGVVSQHAQAVEDVCSFRRQDALSTEIVDLLEEVFPARLPVSASMIARIPIPARTGWLPFSAVTVSR